ncbi:MAG: ABC transporter ATP-binding protein, partial [Actinobacteria bacterium]|nr:ABC transporter ATP-binding protein [Actinomycetota bacterium]
VLENGRVVQEGPAADLLKDEAIITAYLGGGHEMACEVGE